MHITVFWCGQISLRYEKVRSTFLITPKKTAQPKGRAVFKQITADFLVLVVVVVAVLRRVVLRAVAAVIAVVAAVAALIVALVAL